MHKKIAFAVTIAVKNVYSFYILDIQQIAPAFRVSRGAVIKEYLSSYLSASIYPSVLVFHHASRIKSENATSSASRTWSSGTCPPPRLLPLGVSLRHPPSNLDAGTKSAGVHHVYGPPEVPRPDVSIKAATSGSFYVL